jgi:hypothetical protein
MTSLARSIGIAVGILVLAGVRNASAQITDPVEFTAPFAFTVGFATLPAGNYTIKPDDDNLQFLELTGAHGSVLFQTESAEAPKAPSKTEVVFKRYGDGYVLKDIWVEGSHTGAKTIPGEGEKHVTKQRASGGEQRVAARRQSATAKAR